MSNKEMTIEEAIKMETMKKELALQLGNKPSADAHQLNIEALERCRSNYLNPQQADFRRLPSERAD